MATTNKDIYIDGILYKAGEEIPDLGSITCVDSFKNVRNYQGLSADASKLPRANDKYTEAVLGTGSSCLMVDTADFYKYQRSTDTWYKF